MLVKYWMNKTPATIDADDVLTAASDRFKDDGIRMLPVVDTGQLVGVVTREDLARALADIEATISGDDTETLLAGVTVRSIMTHPPITVPTDYSVEETAEIMLEKNIQAVPVTDTEGELAGVITQTDIFKVLISLTGVKRKGVEFALLVLDRPGSIREITDLIRRFGGRMSSILTSYERCPAGYRRVYIRMFNVDRFKLNVIKEKIPPAAKLLYMKNRPEIVRGLSSDPAGSAAAPPEEEAVPIREKRG